MKREGPCGMLRPMDRRELLEKPRPLKPWREEQGVADLRLFGSFARDEAKADSDVDLMCRSTRRMDLDFFGIQIELGEKLGREVELFQDVELRPWAKKRADADAIVA